MAYRQLRSVTFAVLGLVALGCGGNTSTSAPTGSSPSDNPPVNADRPPSGADQAPASSETPPSNTDAPPSTVDAPAGSGSLGGLCQQLCADLSQAVVQCDPTMGDLGMGNVCSGANDCKVPASVLPCESQIASLFQCLIDNLSTLCIGTRQSGDQGQGGRPAVQLPQGSPCVAAVSATQACATANHIDLSSDMGMNMNPPGGDCTTGSACTQCTCKAGSDTTKLLACASGACATP